MLIMSIFGNIINSISPTSIIHSINPFRTFRRNTALESQQESLLSKTADQTLASSQLANGSNSTPELDGKISVITKKDLETKDTIGSGGTKDKHPKTVKQIFKKTAIIPISAQDLNPNSPDEKVHLYIFVPTEAKEKKVKEKDGKGEKADGVEKEKKKDKADKKEKANKDEIQSNDAKTEKKKDKKALELKYAVKHELRRLPISPRTRNCIMAAQAPIRYGSDLMWPNGVIPKFTYNALGASLATTISEWPKDVKYTVTYLPTAGYVIIQIINPAMVTNSLAQFALKLTVVVTGKMIQQGVKAWFKEGSSHGNQEFLAPKLYKSAKNKVADLTSKVKEGFVRVSETASNGFRGIASFFRRNQENEAQFIRLENIDDSADSSDALASSDEIQNSTNSIDIQPETNETTLTILPFDENQAQGNKPVQLVIVKNDENEEVTVKAVKVGDKEYPVQKILVDQDDDEDDEDDEGSKKKAIQDSDRVRTIKTVAMFAVSSLVTIGAELLTGGGLFTTACSSVPSAILKVYQRNNLPLAERYGTMIVLSAGASIVDGTQALSNLCRKIPHFEQATVHLAYIFGGTLISSAVKDLKDLQSGKPFSNSDMISPRILRSLNNYGFLIRDESKYAGENAFYAAIVKDKTEKKKDKEKKADKADKKEKKEKVEKKKDPSKEIEKKKKKMVPINFNSKQYYLACSEGKFVLKTEEELTPKPPITVKEQTAFYVSMIAGTLFFSWVSQPKPMYGQQINPWSIRAEDLGEGIPPYVFNKAMGTAIKQTFDKYPFTDSVLGFIGIGAGLRTMEAFLGQRRELPLLVSSVPETFATGILTKWSKCETKGKIYGEPSWVVGKIGSLFKSNKGSKVTPKNGSEAKTSVVIEEITETNEAMAKAAKKAKKEAKAGKTQAPVTLEEIVTVGPSVSQQAVV